MIEVVDYPNHDLHRDQSAQSTPRPFAQSNANRAAPNHFFLRRIENALGQAHFSMIPRIQKSGIMGRKGF